MESDSAELQDLKLETITSYDKVTDLEGGKNRYGPIRVNIWIKASVIIACPFRKSCTFLLLWLILRPSHVDDCHMSTAGTIHIQDSANLRPREQELRLFNRLEIRWTESEEDEYAKVNRYRWPT